jgi:hypothetical protein
VGEWAEPCALFGRNPLHQAVKRPAVESYVLESFMRKSLRNRLRICRIPPQGDDAGIRALRDDLRAHPLAWANGQAELWRRTGLANVLEVPIVLSFDYWSSFSTGPSRIAQRLTALPAETRNDIERHVRAGYLAGLSDGARSFAIIVRAVRGTVPD